MRLVVDRVPGPRLPTPRRRHGAGLLPDGRVVLVGGNRRPPEEPSDASACAVEHFSSAEVLLIDAAGCDVAAGPSLQQAREGAAVHVAPSGGLTVAGGLIDYG